MEQTNFNDELFEQEARVAAIYPIGMIGDPEGIPDWLKELYEAVVEPKHPLFQALPELKADADDASEWAESLIISRRTGFVVKFEVCIRKYLKPPVTAWNSSWGFYSVRYIYVEGAADIGTTVLTVVREYHEACRQKVLQAAPAEGAAQ